jgi:starch phosphorylase
MSGTIGYFSMEIALDPLMPTYSGGLGVLAGDTLRAAADLGIPMIGVTLLYRKGYFNQHLDSHGNQEELPVEWNPKDLLEPQKPIVRVRIEDREIKVMAWKYPIKGMSGHSSSVYFLDTQIPENEPYYQTLTDKLYGSDLRYRLCQETILGLGGVAMLRELGYKPEVYHMNEGHSALLTLALLEEQIQENGPQSNVNSLHERVQKQCVFTTHTPVPAGHDQFPLTLVRQVLGEERTKSLISNNLCLNRWLNMTHLGLSLSHYINGVAMRHQQVSRDMFPSYPINSITNGVHAFTWVSAPFSTLFDSHIPEWQYDNLYLRYAISIPKEEIKNAHIHAKQDMLLEIQHRTGVQLNPEVMTLGFARRATSYKRAELLFQNLERLKHISKEIGPLQILYGGKAHPRDEGGKNSIHRVFEAADALKEYIQVIYLAEYDMALAKYLCSGVDLWLNTPQKPHEASGTSGMKAALNGVPSLSVLDGWWIEGHIEGVTGWSIGDSWSSESNPVTESTSLYDKLEKIIVPMFYQNPDMYAEVMRKAIALNGSFFNTQRMIAQYRDNAYLRKYFQIQ